MLAKPYDLKLPARTVGKRVREAALPTAEEAAVAAAAAALAEASREVAARKRDVQAARRQEQRADEALSALSPPDQLLHPCGGTQEQREEWWQTRWRR